MKSVLLLPLAHCSITPSSLLLSLSLFTGAGMRAENYQSQSIYMTNHIEKTLLAAVTATTTSDPVNVEGLRRIGFQLKRADHSSGSSAFTFEGTINGTDWTALNVVVSNVTNDAGADTAGAEVGRTRVATITLSSDSTALCWLEDLVVLKAVRVKATEDTDGTHSAWLIASE